MHFLLLTVRWYLRVTGCRSKRVLLHQIKLLNKWWTRWRLCMQLHFVSNFSLMDPLRHSLTYLTACGNRKRARKRLRGGYTSKNHHFSTFRSGLFIGAAIPAIIDGFVRGQCIFDYYICNSLVICWTTEHLNSLPTAYPTGDTTLGCPSVFLRCTLVTRALLSFGRI